MAYQYPQQQIFPPIDPSMQGAPGLPATGMAPPQAPLPGQSPMVNPALAASVIGLQGQASQQQQADRARKMADAMRADASNQLQGQQAGRVFKSSGIANLAASLANNYGAHQLNQRADTQQGAADQQRIGAMQDYFNALTGQPSNGPGVSTPRDPYSADGTRRTPLSLAEQAAMTGGAGQS